MGCHFPENQSIFAQRGKAGEKNEDCAEQVLCQKAIRAFLMPSNAPMAVIAKSNFQSLRILLVITVIVVTAVTFWIGSRYPSLDEKAIMGGSAQLEDPLAFEALIQIQPSDSLLVRIVYTTINWVETVLEGMAFGLVIGACFLTLIGMIPVRGHRNGFVNSLIGVAVGSPLGVCVNCSAPVAKGLHDGGARLETTLATMFSSPTLNVIVLSMLFSIFPLYLVVIKLSQTLLFILVLVPLLSRWAFREERVQTYDDSFCLIEPPSAPQVDESWPSVVRNTSILLGRNLSYIVIRTVPLMLLAGILGAVVANVIPLQTLVDYPPSILSVAVIALVGIFLPVPVAFDLILVAVLITAGAPMIYSMTLLFTLGIFSVYPFLIVWKTISPRVAVILTVVLVLIGVAGGIIAEEIHQAEIRDMLEFLEQGI
ncbi:MAG: permease [Proteobacteria bacterium]|nr:permease [Pseudomonadota bacterium]